MKEPTGSTAEVCTLYFVILQTKQKETFIHMLFICYELYEVEAQEIVSLRTNLMYESGSFVYLSLGALVQASPPTPRALACKLLCIVLSLCPSGSVLLLFTGLGSSEKHPPHTQPGWGLVSSFRFSPPMPVTHGVTGDFASVFHTGLGMRPPFLSEVSLAPSCPISPGYASPEAGP